VRLTSPGKRAVWTVCKFLVGFSLLAFLLWRNWDPAGGLGLAQALRRPAQPVPLLLAVAFCVLGPLFGVLRWHCLVRAQGLTLSLREALRLSCISYFWSTILPGSIGGDVVKAVLLAREQDRRAAAVATVLIDRIVGLAGLIGLAALVGGLFWVCEPDTLRQQPALRWVVNVAIGVSSALLLTWVVAILLPERYGSWFGGWLKGLPIVGPTTGNLWLALWLYRRRQTSVTVATLLAVLGHVCFLLNFYFAALVFQDSVAAMIPSMAQHFLIVPAGLLCQTIFPAPGGIGGGEYVFGQLYTLLGAPEARGVLGALTARAISWGVCIVGGLIYLAARRKLTPPIVESVPTSDIPDSNRDVYDARKAA
jgi:uncharacterized membrane protein YbhN (UPF0104 family)